MERLGPGGGSPGAADLMDFAATVYRLERLFRRQSTNPSRRVKLRLPLREPDRWDEGAAAAARELLLNLGCAHWDI